MGDVHYLKSDDLSRQRLLEKLVGEAIDTHPNVSVARRWREMAKETLRKFPGAPAPSQETLDLDMVGALTDLERARLVDAVQNYVESYANDVNKQVQAMHGEMLLLQRAVAEFEIGSSEKIP